MFKTLFTLVICCASVQAQSTPIAAGEAAPNQVIQWNRNLLAIVRTAGAQPPTIHPTRSFAMMHAAIYDAVNNIDGRHESYAFIGERRHRNASEEAAAASAAHDVLAELYPALRMTLDDELTQSLVIVPDGTAKERGIKIGQKAAEQILALRTGDGSDLQPAPFVFGSAPGDFQSTPPNFPKAQFTGWSKVTPFALAEASQFRPAPPPALTSNAYTDAFKEVKSQGFRFSITAKAEEALTGRFWNGAIQNYWNEIAQTAAIDHHLNATDSARLFALLNVTFADGVIAFYDAKYTYDFWRPVSAIRGAASDGNDATLPSNDWLPEAGNTTPDPSYPGAHAVISAAASEVLTWFFQSDNIDLTVTSEVMPGVTRHFNSFSETAREASASRIFAGVHFRFDEDAGEQLGKNVAGYVVENYFRPLQRKD